MPKLAYRLIPQLANHRLATCCEAAGLKYDRMHSALADARAAAELLNCYLDLARRAGMKSIVELGCKPDRFPFSVWPSMPGSGRVALRSATGRPVADLPFLARLVASLDSVAGATERTAPYVDLLDRVLEDRLVTEAEGEALHATARDLGLSREEVIAAHHSYLESLVGAALADGNVSELERRDLEAVTHLLALDDSMLRATLSRLGSTASPDDFAGVLPTDALAGKTVCFTGTLAGDIEGRPITRDLAHQLAAAAGLAVVDRVTKDLDILVVADPNTQSGKARRARKLGTRIMAEAAFWRAIGVQAD
jgi:DNA polymerase-3 subunit epsilon